MTKKRCAIYIRVSTAEQAEHGTSLEGQRADLTAYAKKQGWTVAGVWGDSGVSGSRETEDRPALRELMATARGGSVQVVLVAAWDRLARNLRAQLDMWHQLDGLGVEYFSLAEPNSSGEEGAFVRHIMASVAEEERRKIRQRTSSGRRRAVAAGKWPGGDLAPFGYRVVDQRLVPDPVEAETIRRLVELMVDERKTTGETAKILNAEGRMPRKAPRWTLILVRNQALWSVDTWAGKFRYGKGSKEGEIVVDLPDPIISAERAEALRLVVATTALPKRTGNAVHPLTGRITCLECGRVVTAIARGGRVRRYLCSNTQGQKSGSKETRCVSPSIHGPSLDAAIWGAIRPYLERPELLLAEAATAAKDTGSLPAAEATVDAARKTLAAVASRGIKMGLDDETVLAMKKDAQADYDAAVRYRDGIAQQVAAAKASANALSGLADMAARMADRLDNPTDELMRDVFRALDVQVVVKSYEPLAVEATGRVLFEDGTYGSSGPHPTGGTG